MKVIHLATHDNYGGAARAAYRQHLALLGEGIDSRMLVRHKHSDDPRVQVYLGERGLYCRIDRTFRRSWIERLEKTSRSHGAGSLTDPRADLLRSSTSAIEEADVINIHKTERFVDLPALLGRLPPEKPIVMTVHDISPMTGGCDYPGECGRFQRECGMCPILKSDSLNDYSRKIFNLRKAAYASRDKSRFALAADSHWTAEMARKSALTSNCRIDVIHYGIDQSIYSPTGRDEARRALGIGLDEEVLCFAAQNLSLPHKGGRCLSEALAAIPEGRSMRLLTMGSGHFAAPERFHHMAFGKIESDQLQALIYRAADVFVIPSLEEAFGQTALEAISCGTVVAGFQVGGIVDIVKNGLNGELVPRGDSLSLSRAIESLLNHGAMRREWASQAEEWVRERFSYHRNATSYSSLYHELMEGIKG